MTQDDGFRLCRLNACLSGYRMHRGKSAVPRGKVAWKSWCDVAVISLVIPAARVQQDHSLVGGICFERWAMGVKSSVGMRVGCAFLTGQSC